jgi:glyoxylase-like metal-dependent hydrolase (beta-lactamase superfamily II)
MSALPDAVRVLDFEGPFRGTRVTVHPVLILDPQGQLLVDTGLPGQGETLRRLLAQHGAQPATVRWLVLTHQDLDHIGNAPEVVAESGAEVYAHRADAPFIEGERLLLKLAPERLATLAPEARAFFEEWAKHPPRVRVSRLVEDGQTLPVAGGVRVVYTPGHTPGHLSLYLEAHRVLVAGDALVVADGQLRGPRPEVTLDMAEAMRSVAKLAALEPEFVVCYHGGVYGPGAARRLHEIASTGT